MSYACPGFSWDRVNFIQSNWDSAMFGTQYENNFDNILMFLVVARQSRTFQLLTLAWAARCTGSWEGIQPGQLAPTDQSDIPYCMASCSAYNVGEE